MTELARLYAADPQLTEGEVVRRIGVPAGVRDVVHRRLAHLDGPTSEVLQMAAVLGPLAEVGLLAAAMAIPVDDCLDRLEPALAARLLLDDDDVVGAVHFSHGLVREVVLDDMSTLRRARLHLRAADAIEARSHRPSDVAEIVAEHLWQAASVAPAERVADALERAAMVSTGRFGLQQADELLDRALQLRRTLPADRTDVGAELALISRLAAVRRARYGYEQALRHTPLAHAKELARSADEIDTLIDLLWTEWAGVATAGDIATARRLATELVAAAGENPDPLVIAAAASSWGVQCWHEGRIDEAVTALDRAVLNHESAAASAPMGELINPLVDHRTICFGFHAMVHVMAGDPLDELPLHMMSAERLAPHQRMTMELTDAMRATLAHQWDTALLASERALAVETDAAFGFFLAAVHCVHGSALIALDRAAEGVAEMEAAIEQYLAMGAKTVMPFYMTRLAVGHLVLGDVAAAARTLERAQSVLDETGERWNEPYVLAARAAVGAAAGADAAEVAAQLALAQDVAMGQGADGVAARLAADLRTLGFLAG